MIVIIDDEEITQILHGIKKILSNNFLIKKRSLT